ncbi:hypothetical protein CJ19_003 [Escherichia phage CJ19]|nr:hypothetical protein CJ19_003 [Escherichia phage CJ19]
MEKLQFDLTEQDQFLLFRGLVCKALTMAGFKGDAWEFSNLDMSFEEVQGTPFESWSRSIAKDLADYKRDCPEDFHE